MNRGVVFVTVLLISGVTAQAADNTPPSGFQAIFNGKDLKGWEGAIPMAKRQKMTQEQRAAAQKQADSKILPHWKVIDGVLVNDGEGDNLATVKDYRNFELMVDWKIEPKGDSGLYLRGIPQVQIWDSDTLMGNLAADKGLGSGGLWNNPKGTKGKTPSARADKAPGEWNSFHIIMKGDLVTVHLNGQRVVEAAPLPNIWEPKSPLPERGPLELQRHPKQDGTLGKLWFKNIYLKELPD